MKEENQIFEFGLDHVLHYRPIQVIGKINYYSQFIHDIHYTIHIQTITILEINNAIYNTII
jgi:hypothetical protein